MQHFEHKLETIYRLLAQDARIFNLKFKGKCYELTLNISSREKGVIFSFITGSTGLTNEGLIAN